MELKTVSKSFGEGATRTDVLKDIDLQVEEGEFLVLLGFSGTGKTTLINLLAGLDTPSKGMATFKGAQITGPGPERGVSFQSYSLMPWLTVNGNVGLAVDTVFPKLSRAERAEKVAHYVGMVGLSHATTRRPAELSGGEQQRVALARAAAPRPNILLADEPTGNLDSQTGAAIIDMLFGLQARHSATLVLVTHDPGLADRCDRVIELHDGQLTERPQAPDQAARAL